MTTKSRLLGRIIETLNIESRGPAILLDLKLIDFPMDLEIRIGDQIRISLLDNRVLDAVVCGVEYRPLLALLLPVGTDLNGFMGATVEHAPQDTKINLQFE
jgi:hypothetical protein